MGKVVEFRPFDSSDKVKQRFKAAFEFGSDRALDLIDALHAKKMDDTYEEMTGSIVGALHILMWCAMDCSPSREDAIQLIEEARRVAEQKMDDSI